MRAKAKTRSRESAQEEWVFETHIIRYGYGGKSFAFYLIAKCLASWMEWARDCMRVSVAVVISISIRASPSSSSHVYVSVFDFKNQHLCGTLPSMCWVLTSFSRCIIICVNENERNGCVEKDLMGILVSKRSDRYVTSNTSISRSDGRKSDAAHYLNFPSIQCWFVWHKCAHLLIILPSSYIPSLQHSFVGAYRWWERSTRRMCMFMWHWL